MTSCAELRGVLKFYGTPGGTYRYGNFSLFTQSTICQTEIVMDCTVSKTP